MIRRRLLIAGATLFSGLVALALLPVELVSRVPVYRNWLALRVANALRELVGQGGTGGLGSAARKAGLTPDQALGKLMSRGSHAAFLMNLSDHGLLRSYLDERQRDDFAAGRVDYLDGWLLSETEICIAALLGD